MITDSMLSGQEMDDISRRAHTFYAERVQAIIEPIHNGEFVALHVDAADYAIGSTSSRARFALRQRHPAGMIVTTRIGPASGDPLAYRILASQLMAEQTQ